MNFSRRYQIIKNIYEYMYCHCAGHPFNKVMEYYVAEKKSQSRSGTQRLPQVVGLTASPGTGKASSLSQAREHILQLCANLDAHKFVTVRDPDNLRELHELMAQPQAGVVSTLYS